MTSDDPGRYRRRIYASYNTARAIPCAPATIKAMGPRAKYFGRLIDRNFPSDRNAVILELGSGHGTFLFALRSAGYLSCRGVDGSAEQVQIAASLGVNVEKLDLMEALRSTEDDSVDVVVAFDVVEHFTKAETIELIDHVYRVLRTNGRWLLHLPNAEGPFSANVRYSDFTHEQAFTRISIDQVLRASGFSSVHCFEDKPFVKSVPSFFRSVLWVVIRAMLISYLAVETGRVDRKAIFSQNMLVVARKNSRQDPR